MEICQFCKIYMKPFIDKEDHETAIATCEFCGEKIAVKVKGKWTAETILGSFEQLLGNKK